MPARLPTRLITRTVFALLVPLFALCVVVQFNDPDPVPWIAIYTAAGLVCAGVAANIRVAEFAGVTGAIALLWALTQVHSVVSFLESDKEPMNFTMKTGDAEEEEAREAGGLALVVAACAAAVVVDVRKRRS